VIHRPPGCSRGSTAKTTNHRRHRVPRRQGSPAATLHAEDRHQPGDQGDQEDLAGEGVEDGERTGGFAGGDEIAVPEGGMVTKLKYWMSARPSAKSGADWNRATAAKQAA